MVGEDFRHTKQNLMGHPLKELVSLYTKRKHLKK